MGVDETPTFLAANNLKPHVSKELSASTAPTAPIAFIDQNGQLAYGYKAEALPQVCVFFVDADAGGEGTEEQREVRAAGGEVGGSESDMGILNGRGRESISSTVFGQYVVTDVNTRTKFPHISN